MNKLQHRENIPCPFYLGDDFKIVQFAAEYMHGMPIMERVMTLNLIHEWCGEIEICPGSICIDCDMNGENDPTISACPQCYVGTSCKLKQVYRQLMNSIVQ